MADITLVKVIMRNFNIAGIDTSGKPVVETHEAIDFVGTDILDAYVADAQQRWASVTTEDNPTVPQDVIDGGYTVPDHLNVEA